MKKSTDDKKQKAVNQARQESILETLKSVGAGVGLSIKEDLLAAGSKDILHQLFQSRMQQRSYSGEIRPGEDLPMKDVFSGAREKEEKLQKQMSLERMLRDQEDQLRSQKFQELRVKLSQIIEEIKAISSATPQLQQEIEVAAMQAPENPGIYHVFFFQRILEFVKSFRKNISHASEWLHAANRRARKSGNVWLANYRKNKGSYLLSSEHYLQRSAG